MFYGKLLLSGILTNWSGISIGVEKTLPFNNNIVRKVVRHPVTSIPFIPASSFRGAIRRVLEKERGAPCNHRTQKEYQECPLCQILGISEKDAQHFSLSQPGRLSIRDIFLTQESEIYLIQNIQQCDITSMKIYNAMDRITGQGIPYAIEEIPAGCYFYFDFIFTLYEKNDIQYFEKFLQCLLALESNSLGRGGSRGLGKIRFGEWILQDQSLYSGLSLTWHSQKYYDNGEEIFIFFPNDKLGIEGMLTEMRKIKSAINN